jgi:hypothetical protein
MSSSIKLKVQELHKANKTKWCLTPVHGARKLLPSIYSVSRVNFNRNWIFDLGIDIRQIWNKSHPIRPHTQQWYKLITKLSLKPSHFNLLGTKRKSLPNLFLCKYGSSSQSTTTLGSLVGIRNLLQSISNHNGMCGVMQA